MCSIKQNIITSTVQNTQIEQKLISNQSFRSVIVKLINSVQFKCNIWYNRLWYYLGL